MSIKIIVTGGSGFIGTNLIEEFIENSNYEVLNIDILPPRNNKHAQYWKQCDITIFNDLSKIVLDFDPDYIVHLAARTDILGHNINEYPANTVGVENLLKCCYQLKNLKKVLFTSSMLVMRSGHKAAHILDYCPPNAYGISKVETESIVRDNHLTCDWAILRPTSIWGPWFDTYKDFFKMIMAGRYLSFGKKLCTKTYGFVGNVVYQIDCLLKTDTTKEKFEDRIFYLGDKPDYDISEWGQEIADICGKKIHHIPFFIIKIAAYVGDFIKLFGVMPPMSSFRLRNMMTNNIMDVTPTFKYAPNPPFTRKQASEITVKWIKENNF